MDLLIGWAILAPIGLGVNGKILADTVIGGLALHREGKNGAHAAVTMWHLGEEVIRVLIQVVLIYYCWRAWAYFGWDRSSSQAIEQIVGGLTMSVIMLTLGVWSEYWRRRVAQAEAARERD